MQINDDHNWVQWTLGGFSAVGALAFGWIVRMVSSLRRKTEDNRDRIVNNSQAIAVNSALRDETNKRYQEIGAKLDSIAKEHREGLSALDRDHRKDLENIHSRINDVLKVIGKTSV